MKMLTLLEAPTLILLIVVAPFFFIVGDGATNLPKFFSIVQEEDQLLCNNAPGGGRESADDQWCYVSNSGEKVLCDDRRTTPEQCLRVDVELSLNNNGNDNTSIITIEQQLLQLSELFAHSDFNISIRRLHITYPLSMNNRATSLLDELLTPRPWMFVRAQTFPWLHEQQGKDFDTTGSAVAAMPGLSMTIDRYHPVFEPYLRAVGAINYPADASMCEKVPHVIARNSGTHPGWGSVLAMVFMTVDYNFPYTVLQSFIHGQNETAYTSYEDCPDKFNRWECSFLKTSNCTPPVALLSDKTFKLAHEGTTFFFTPIYKTRSADHIVPEDRDSEEYKELVVAAHTPYSFEQKDIVEAGQAAAGHYFVYRQRYFANHGIQAMYSLWWWTYFLRRNNFYRDISMRYIHKFKESHGVDFSRPDQRCVVGQVRRGDHIQLGRIGEVLPKNVSFYCQMEGDVDTGCPPIEDAGKSEKNIPFAYITLDNIIEGMNLVNNYTDSGTPATNLILFSDDGKWVKEVQEEAKLRHLPFKIYDFPFVEPRSQTSSSSSSSSSTVEQSREEWHEIRIGRGTAHLLASIHLAQQCEALLGNFQSAVPKLFQQAMCVEHNGRQGVCPPWADIRFGKLSAPFFW